jgi:hypothetical protein
MIARFMFRSLPMAVACQHHSQKLWRKIDWFNRGTLRMPGNPREMITVAERRLSVRIRISVPPGGLG